MKIKQVSYERLETDPHGYNNTRISMVADLDKNDDPIQIINTLRKTVLERHDTYREVQQIRREIMSIASSLSFNNSRLHQLKLTDETELKISEINIKIQSQEREIEILKHKMHKILE